MMQLNKQLVTPDAPPGGSGGATYSYVYKTATGAGMSYYRIESVDIYGTTELFGPVSAQPN